jgi:hypothetical protein
LPAPQLGPEPERLRAAYLQLLKLSLCDLTGACTREIRWTSDKRVFWRHLTDAEQVSGRVEGKDWPLDGLTMIGLRRLDDLQACVESVLADGVAGDLIEAGAWRGGASILIRSTLDAWGARDRTLWVADSFQGFPSPQADAPAADREVESDMGRIDYLAPGLAAVKEHFARFGVLHGVRFVPGFFDDTLPALAGRRWALIRLDADTYHATRLTLESLYPGLAAGGYVLIDDYFHPYLPESCRRAVDEFRAEHGITDPIEQADWNGGHWRKSADPASHDVAGPALAPEDALAPDSVLPGRELALLPTAPSDHELQLRDEVDALRSRVGTADRGPAPPESLAARLRRLVGGG